MFGKAALIAGANSVAVAAPAPYTGAAVRDPGPAVSVAGGMVAGAPTATGPEQTYAPHGSVHSNDVHPNDVHPNDARRGATFHIEAVHTDLQGTTYHSVTNGCVIP